MRGTIQQAVDRARLLLLAVALLFCCVPTARALRSPTTIPALDWPQPGPRLSEENRPLQQNELFGETGLTIENQRVGTKSRTSSLGAFGKLTAQWGPLAGANAMQFSSMPHHANSGLSLYPLRAYDPSFQRWVTRDPIGEAGGINLYQYVRNDPLGNIDPLGLDNFLPGGENAVPALSLSAPVGGGGVTGSFPSPLGDPFNMLAAMTAGGWGGAGTAGIGAGMLGSIATDLGVGEAWLMAAYIANELVKHCPQKPMLGMAQQGPAAQGGAGGKGPVLQGQAGVDRAIAQIEAEGGQVLGTEITVDAGGVRTRPDIFVQNADGSYSFVEVKNGPSAGLTPNQTIGYPAIQAGGAVPAGANAAATQVLTPGVPVGPIPVRAITYP
jgi:RHS repeat-associated protein